MQDNASWWCDKLSPHKPVQGFRYVFPFEQWVKISWAVWWQSNWTLCFWMGAFYVAGVLVGQRLMRQRPAFHLRGPLLAWNVFVATYSLLTGARVGTEILAQGRSDGFLATICDNGPLEHQKLLSTYLALFAISKVVELGDTAFLVLRRKPVPFVHCFHHLLILLVTWAYTGYPSKVGTYFMAMNQAVHFLAYSYQAMKMLRVPMPAAMVPLLAALELLQALAGLAITAYAAHTKSTGYLCCIYPETMNIIHFAYVTFAVVFSWFVLRAILRRGNSRKDKRE